MVSSSIIPIPSPIKGKADWREYKAFELENGVVCLVIHDKESKTTAMSCSVNVGAAADPRTHSGLAHFCEHMCFLGSVKYPGENEYKRYLSSHGGRSNASTSMHLTTYKFEILKDFAERAVDIFSNFFIGPLFTASGTGREVQAVDSENSKNLTADGRRRLQILKDIGDPDHYYTKFSTGNSKTLQTDDPEKLELIRSALLTFHAKHYKPENMTVVIAGPQQLDTLQDWIVERFSKIEKKSFPNSSSDSNNNNNGNNGKNNNNMSPIEKLISDGANDAPPFSFKEANAPYNSPFRSSLNGSSSSSSSSSWPMLVTTKPLRSMRKLAMLFPLESYRKIPDKSPSSILSHLLGHEGQGSIFALLQNHGMINSLSAGPRVNAPDFQLFQLDLGLTEKGEEHWKEVVDIVFAYCRLVNEKLEQESSNNESSSTTREFKRIWGESLQLDRIFFNETSPAQVYAYVPNLAQRLVAYGSKNCLTAGFRLDETEETFPLELVKKTAKQLNPHNCFIERCSEVAWTEAEKRTLSGKLESRKRTEQWYGVDYYTSQIDSDVVSSWNGGGTRLESEMDATDMNLPRPNMYIPRTLDLCHELPDEAKTPRIEKPIDPPNLLIENDGGRLFHRLDDRYALPKSCFNLLIRNAATQHVKSTNGGWEYSAIAGTKSSMLCSMFNQAMAQETYDADLAGLYWSLNLGPSGMKFSFTGFSDRLPDLTLKILGEFLSGDFMQESYFDSTKDNVIRGLSTYLSSRRADSHAVYYRDALLASKNLSIEDNLEFAKQIELVDVKEHFDLLIQNEEIFIDCLATGNISAKNARDLFANARASINDTIVRGQDSSKNTMSYIPAGHLERRIQPGADIEIHFQSNNQQEENGAVVVSYQSSIPAYRGSEMSNPLSLDSTSAIRLLGHMLREPLFDELRTKQQLGYIVHAYHEVGVSSRQPESVLGPLTVPVDFITINVLSRKVSPPEVASRIDEFLSNFRDSLEKMPESEIRDHANALSTKLLKPIQKLTQEANLHFNKIQYYAPERKSFTWDLAPALASRIQSLTRTELLQTWDRMIDPARRSRVVSCVYGKTFPLQTHKTRASSLFQVGQRRSTINIVNNFSSLIEHRKQLDIFDNEATKIRKRNFSTKILSLGLLSSSPSSTNAPLLVGIGAVGLAGLVGWSLMRNSKLERR